MKIFVLLFTNLIVFIQFAVADHHSYRGVGVPQNKIPVICDWNQGLPPPRDCVEQSNQDILESRIKYLENQLRGLSTQIKKTTPSPMTQPTPQRSPPNRSCTIIKSMLPDTKMYLFANCNEEVKVTVLFYEHLNTPVEQIYHVGHGGKAEVRSGNCRVLDGCTLRWEIAKVEWLR